MSEKKVSGMLTITVARDENHHEVTLHALTDGDYLTTRLLDTIVKYVDNLIGDCDTDMALLIRLKTDEVVTNEG